MTPGLHDPGRSRLVATLLAVAATVATGSCGPGEPGDTRDGPDRVRVVAQPYLAFGALWVARSEGHFARHGLDVEFVRIAGTEPAVPLLITGAVDVLPAHPAPGLLNGMRAGAPVRMVAAANGGGIGGCSPVALLRGAAAVPESRAPGTASAAGRISVSDQALMRFVADRMLSHASHSLDRWRVVDVPVPARADALASGAIDALVAGEPFLTRTLDAGAARPWVALEEALPGARLSFLFFGQRLLEDEPDVGIRFLAAYLSALRQLSEGKSARNVAALAEATGEEPDLLRRACWPFAEPDGRPRLDLLMDFQRWALERGLLDGVAEGRRIWDSTYLEAARGLLEDSLHGR